MWEDIFSALKAMDFDRLQEVLSRLDLMTLLKDPWVIGAIVLASIVMLIKGMEKALVTFLSVPALILIFEMSVRGDIDLERSGHKLLIFAGGFVAVAAINVYVHFIRS